MLLKSMMAAWRWVAGGQPPLKDRKQPGSRDQDQRWLCATRVVTVQEVRIPALPPQRLQNVLWAGRWFGEQKVVVRTLMAN